MSKVIIYSKEYAQEKIRAHKKGKTKEVLEWLEAVARFLPSEESYRENLEKHRREDTTSKQKNRKKKLKETRNGRRER